MGHRILAEGVQPDRSKVAAILDMPPPSDVHGVRRLWHSSVPGQIHAKSRQWSGTSHGIDKEGQRVELVQRVWWVTECCEEESHQHSRERTSAASRQQQRRSRGSNSSGWLLIPRAILGNFFLGAQEVSRSCCLLILATPTRHSKGAPLCRYTGVARKVSFKLRPKDRKKVSSRYWKCVVPRGETNKQTKQKNTEKTEE